MSPEGTEIELELWMNVDGSVSSSKVTLKVSCSDKYLFYTLKTESPNFYDPRFSKTFVLVKLRFKNTDLG